MGFAADVAEYGREHDFMEAWHMFHDPGPDRSSRSRRRSRERQREWERESQRQEMERQRRDRQNEKLAAVVRQCVARRKTRADFLAACEIVGAADDPLAVAESGEEVVATIYDWLDAEARRRRTSSDELIQERLAERQVAIRTPKSSH